MPLPGVGRIASTLLGGTALVAPKQIDAFRLPAFGTTLAFSLPEGAALCGVEYYL